jgi:hypothetical protein
MGFLFGIDLELIQYKISIKTMHRVKKNAVSDHAIRFWQRREGRGANVQ